MLKKEKLTEVRIQLLECSATPRYPLSTLGIYLYIIYVCYGHVL